MGVVRNKMEIAERAEEFLRNLCLFSAFFAISALQLNSLGRAKQ